MNIHSFLRIAPGFSQRLLYIWHKYGGLNGVCRKLLGYVRKHGLLALPRKIFFVLRENSVQARTSFPAGDGSGMVHLENMSTEKSVSLSICIHIHLFYPDLAAEFQRYLLHMPFPYTLLVSVTTAEAEQVAQKTFGNLKHCGNCIVRLVANRGRDIAPFFCAFGDEVAKHDVVAHVHSKKSSYAAEMGSAWRQYLLDGLLGSARTIRQIMGLFQKDAQLGLVYPQTFSGMPFWAHHWLGNRNWGVKLLGRMGRSAPDATLVDFPVGSMFWARTAALRPLLQLGLRPEDFEEEAGQLDGTLAHALERLIGYISTQDGYGHAVLKMPGNPQALRWGLEQCQDMAGRVNGIFASRRIRLVIFDIFDTLLLRPLYDAEDAKKLTAQRLPAEDAAIYLAWRGEAEQEARIRNGVDVNSEQIFAALAELAGISTERAVAMRNAEMRVEAQSVSANAPVLELLRRIRAYGVRVVYASDMFLPRETIIEMLRDSDVPAPDHLYLSNEIDRRKDTGRMYPYILEAEGVKAEETLMLGDNLHSDIQIASDMGIAALPVLRISDMLQAAPRHARLAQQTFTSLPDSLTIGLIFRYLRQTALPLDVLAPYGIFRNFHGLGYAVLGPVLTGFAAWLALQAKAKGIETLYFLARDGKIMRHAYEAWRRRTGEGPPSEYLEVSRRAVSVPAVNGFDDVMDILSLDFQGSCRMLFAERIGIDISDEEALHLQKRGLWPDFSDPDKNYAWKREQVREVALFLWPRIEEQVRKERPAALAYLHALGLSGARKSGLVDIGYSGSIQYQLSRLLGHPFEGFYLVTGHTLRRKYSARREEMFAYIGEDCQPEDPFIRTSFRMEKLLSASEGQVVNYKDAGSGSIEVCRREFSGQEHGYDTAREQLHAGLDAFIRDACAIHDGLYPAFAPSRSVAAAMWLQLESVKILDTSLLLDDYYCAGSIV